MKNSFSFLLLCACMLISSTLMTQSARPSWHFMDRTSIPLPTVDMPAYVVPLYGESVVLEEVLEAHATYYRERGPRAWSEDLENNPYAKFFHRWVRHASREVDNKGVVKSLNTEALMARRREAALADEQSQQTAKSGPGDTWTFYGPKKTLWRAEHRAGQPVAPWQVNIYSIAVAESDPDLLFAGSETGELYKSTDKGITWTPIMNYNWGRAILSVAIAPQNPDLVYVGTATDVIKSTDGGLSWTPVLTGSSLSCNSIRMHPTDPDVVMAGTASGLMRTLDGGSNWDNVLAEEVLDAAFQPGNPSAIYALTRSGSPATAKLHKSTNSGQSFTLSMTGWGSYPDHSGGRMTVTPAGEEYVYVVLLSSRNGNTPYVLKSTNAASSWTEVAQGKTTALEMNNGQGYYDLDICASHRNPEHLIVATTTAYRSTDGGVNYQAVGGYGGPFDIHPDIQEIISVLDGGEENTWLTTDGGINFSTDFYQNTGNWEARIDGLDGTDFWGFDQGWNEDYVIGGRYHNGNTAMHQNYPEATALRMGGAESATGWAQHGRERHAVFDDISNTIIPEQIGDFAGGTFAFNKYPNIWYYGAGYSRIMVDPADYMTSYVGEGNQYWRSQDGGVSWEALHDFGAEVFHFDISRANPNYVYLIANNGIYRSTDRGASFNSISLPPGLTASNARRGRINVSGTDPDEIWFLDWNAGANSNRDRVWYSSNGGTSWSSWHTPALAGRKWTAMAHQVGSNGGVYIASERGSTGTLPAKVFYRDRGMSQWVDYSAGLPASANPTKILPYYRGNALRWAGNRGVWQIPLYQENWAPVAQPFVDGTERFCQRDAVHFDSYSVAKGNATYQWSIPEATTTTALNQREVTAEFPGPGTYTATLTVSQPGGSSTESVSVTISPECDPEPRPGNSAYFNGSGAATSSEPLNLTTNEMTFSAWIKRDGNQPDNAGIIFMRGGTAVGLNFGNDNELRFHWNNAQWWWDSGLVVNDQEWAHVAMVVTPTGVTLYLNGQPANRSFSAPAVTFDSPLFFGRDPNHSSRYFRGEMDEVCIYNRSLSQAEIRESMHLTRTDGGEVGLLAYYQFNRDEGQVTDRFGTNHLNLGGGAFRGQSTAPVGPGSSARKTITAPGSYGFGDTGLTLNFDTGVTPDGELCVTRLKIQPDRLPAAEVSSSYWVVHNFGVNESFSPLQSLMFAEVNGINAGIVAAPSQLKLYKRKSVGEGDTWGDFVAEATAAATSNGGEVTFGVGNNQTSFSQFIISFETPALGAELLNFTARIQNQKSVDVSWVSSGEENLDRYEVLRSRDGQNFTLLTTVSAAGNSEEELSYGFLDVSPHRGRSFYRLRMVDFDGTVTFSEVRSVVVGALSEPVMLYPNPVARGEQLTVVTDLAGVLSLSLYSVTGQEVGRFVFRGDANLHLGQLPAGVYLYQVRGEAYRKGGRLIITE